MSAWAVLTSRPARETLRLERRQVAHERASLVLPSSDRSSTAAESRLRGCKLPRPQKYVLNPFYNRLVVLFPPSVAPNAITLSGLALVFANFVTVLVVNPSLRCCQDGACRPMWMYVSFALGLFWYQSLDAIDGKQVRSKSLCSAQSSHRDCCWRLRLEEQGRVARWENCLTMAATPSTSRYGVFALISRRVAQLTRRISSCSARGRPCHLGAQPWLGLVGRCAPATPSPLNGR